MVVVVGLMVAEKQQDTNNNNPEGYHQNLNTNSQLGLELVMGVVQQQ